MRRYSYQIALLLSILTSCVFAADATHRELIWRKSINSLMSDDTKLEVWLSPSTIRYETGVVNVRTADGQLVISPGTATSAYDDSLSYDASHFYRLKKPRYSFVVNLSTYKPGRFLSIGYDSSVSAEKLTIQPSIFLGFVDSYALAKNHYVIFSLGSWFGGSIKEMPCYDDYDRRYSCSGSIVAWHDYRPSYPRNYRYIDFKYIYRF